jgi:hypothetical protein
MKHEWPSINNFFSSVDTIVAVTRYRKTRNVSSPQTTTRDQGSNFVVAAITDLCGLRNGFWADMDYVNVTVV